MTVDTSIPLHQIINVVTLTQALLFTAFFVARPARAHLSTWFLVAAFLIMATVKADEIYQMLGGFRRYPEYGFVLSPIQAAMTPVLYLFVAARTSPAFKLKLQHLWHLTPALLTTLYITAIYYRLDLDAKTALIAANGLDTPVNRLIVPLIGDAVQLAYLVAAYRRLEQFGVSLKSWFANVENRDLEWLKRLLTTWGAVFLCHAILITVSSGVFKASALSQYLLFVLDLAHLAIVNLMALLGVADIERRLAEKNTIPIRPVEKYAASALSEAERATLFRAASELLHNKQLFLQPDLTLSDLAIALDASPREVSEAINGVGGKSFFELVNQARVDHARALLIASPEARVLDIAFQSGFNTKSAFNEAFKKMAGMTPTEFRRAHGSPPLARPSDAKTA